MPCVLTAVGKDFDVETYLKKSKLYPNYIWKRGQKYKRKIGGRKASRNSGFSCTVSNKSFDQFNAQIRDAIEFVKFLKRELRRLATFPGIEEVGLDFGITNRALTKNIVVQCDVIPAELARLAGSIGLHIAISLYPGSFRNLKK